MRSSFHLGLFTFALVGAFAACSSTSTTTTETPKDDSGTAKEGGTTTGDSGASGSDSGSAGDTGTTDPDLACGAEATANGCATCCATNHQQGYATFTNTLLACACKGTGADSGVGPCASDCAATACAATPAQPTPACNTCLQQSVGATGACTQTVGSTCQAQADCVAQQKCVTQCQGKN